MEQYVRGLNVPRRGAHVRRGAHSYRSPRNGGMTIFVTYPHVRVLPLCNLYAGAEAFILDFGARIYTMYLYYVIILLYTNNI